MLRALRQVGVVSLALELRAALREPWTCSAKAVGCAFQSSEDPWSYETNPTERERFRDQTDLLDAVRGGEMFRSGLEIGCAAGLYTEILAQRCKLLLALDISPIALEIARRRCNCTGRVQFNTFDLRLEQMPGTFDLIVLAGVLEYFNRPATLFRIRQKLAAALEPGGYLLVESTRRRQLEDSWWGRRLIRGKWINVFIGQHPLLSVEGSVLTNSYAITLCRRIERNPA